MKQMPPAIQEKHRYLKFKVRGKQKNLGEVIEAVWKSATKYMGTNGASKANIWIIGNKYNKKKQEGVIRVNQDRENDLRAALTINNGFKDQTYLSIEKVPGTLKNLK